MKNKLNTFGTWASIIGLVLIFPSGFFFWWWGRETQEPIFYVGEQSVLVDQDNVGRAPISILDKKGEIVTGNVILAKFYFWNNGRKPIVFEEDVIKSVDTDKQEITLYLTEDSSARILSNSCGPILNPQYTGFKDELDQIDPTRLAFTFNVVKHLEGVSCQVIFEGSASTTLEMEGALLEVSSGLDSEASLARLQGSIWSNRLFSFRTLIILNAVIVGVVTGFYISNDKNKRMMQIAFGSIGIMMLLQMIEIITILVNPTEEYNEPIDNTPRVPAEIIPEKL